MSGRHLDFIDEAARQWGLRWDAVEQMHAVTSLMRVQQVVLAQLDELLRPHGLTFARYEALVLLTFSRSGSLPLGKMGERLQVHATSVTSIVDRLEAAGLVVRRRHPDDGRAVLAEITDAGRAVVEAATADLVDARSRSRRCRPTSCTGSPSCCAPSAATPATSDPPPSAASSRESGVRGVGKSRRATTHVGQSALRSTEIVGRPRISA